KYGVRRQTLVIGEESIAVGVIVLHDAARDVRWVLVVRECTGCGLAGLNGNAGDSVVRVVKTTGNGSAFERAPRQPESPILRYCLGNRFRVVSNGEADGKGLARTSDRIIRSLTRRHRVHQEIEAGRRSRVPVGHLLNDEEPATGRNDAIERIVVAAISGRWIRADVDEDGVCRQKSLSDFHV